MRVERHAGNVRRASKRRLRHATRTIGVIGLARDNRLRVGNLAGRSADPERWREIQATFCAAWRAPDGVGGRAAVSRGTARPVSQLLDSVDDHVCNGSLGNIFGAAYVCPVFDVGDNNDTVPFTLNSPLSGDGRIATYDFDAAATERELNFWTVYLLGAYQPDTDRDLDPDDDKGGALGAVDSIRGVGASIYLESIADYNRRASFPTCSEQVTVAHELGHLFGGTHPEGGLMASPCDKAQLALSPRQS
jgi:hypothetical protein